MPDFPTYHGPPLPKVLNPLNPAHYWLVLKWSFFQPNRLKHYLHQVDPELFQARGLRIMLNTLQRPAYRNFYLIAMIASLLTLLGSAYIALAVQGLPMDWSTLLRRWALSIVSGMALGVVVGGTYSVARGTLIGGIFAVMYSIASSVESGTPWGEIIGGASGIVFGIVFGVAIGIVSGVVFGVAEGVAVCVATGVIIGAAGANMAWSVLFSLVFTLAFGIGASRLIFYPFELLWVVLLKILVHNKSQHLAYHPAVWDELAVWPLPGLSHALRQHLTTNFEAALPWVVRVMANPFQRWIAQRALSDWLASQADPLTALQRVAHWSPLVEYLAPPTSLREFRDFPSARVVVLGEIGQRRVDGRDIDQISVTERWTWRLTRPLRRIQPTQICTIIA